MTPAMYIFLNRGLGMSTGKSAAQAGHAAVEAYRKACPPAPDRPESSAYFMETNLIRQWNKGGHYMKLVMEARDREHLLDIDRYLRDRGFDTALIIDEGHTEIDPITPTALGVLVDKDDPHAAATFSSFDLYRDPHPEVAVVETTARLRPEQFEEIKRLVNTGEIGMARDVLRSIEKTERPPRSKRRGLRALWREARAAD